MARILELLQHYLKTFLNFENSLRFENLFKTKAPQKQSCDQRQTGWGTRRQTGWGTKGSGNLADPPSKIRMGLQRAVAGFDTSKSSVGTDKAVHAILSFSLT